MAQFRKAVITEKGLALIQKTQMQNCRLEFTRIRTGAGEYQEDEILAGCEALRDPRQEFAVTSAEIVDHKTVKLEAIFTNDGLETAYYMSEIGVFAADPDGGEVLYSLTVAYPGKADYLPAFDGQMPVRVGLDMYQSVSDAENVTIRIDDDTYARLKDLAIFKENVEGQISAVKEQIKNVESQVEEMGSSGGTEGKTEILNTDVTILASDWTENPDTGNRYRYLADVAVEGITESMIPMLTIYEEYQDTARKCDMYNTVQTLDGVLRVKAITVPEGNIAGSLTLFTVGGTGSGTGGGTGTGGSYTLPVASATRLGGVKIGEGLSVGSDGTISVDGTEVLKGHTATDADTREMLEKVFNG